MDKFLKSNLDKFITSFNEKKITGKKKSLPFCVKFYLADINNIIRTGYKYSDIYDYLNANSERKISKGHWYETIKRVVEVNSNENDRAGDLPVVSTNNNNKQNRSIFENLNSTKKRDIEHNSMHTFKRK